MVLETAPNSRSVRFRDAVGGGQFFRFHALRSGSYLLRLLGCELDASAALQVLGVCHRLEVLRIDAVAHATQVIELHPIRDWSDLLLVHGAMRVHRTTSDGNAGVALVVDVAEPHPARCLVTAIFDRIVARP